jgi:hypothetical protein
VNWRIDLSRSRSLPDISWRCTWALARMQSQEKRLGWNLGDNERTSWSLEMRSSISRIEAIEGRNDSN